MPVNLENPKEMKYEYMIHRLAKAYGQCKYYVADNYTERDFFEMLCFNNLDTEQQKFINDN